MSDSLLHPILFWWNNYTGQNSCQFQKWQPYILFQTFLCHLKILETWAKGPRSNSECLTWPTSSEQGWAFSVYLSLGWAGLPYFLGFWDLSSTLQINGAFLHWLTYFNMTAESLKKIYSTRMRFLPPQFSLSHWVMPHIRSSLCCNISHLPNFSFAF